VGGKESAGTVHVLKMFAVVSLGFTFVDTIRLCQAVHQS
jgi:hypothetical protein